MGDVIPVIVAIPRMTIGADGADESVVVTYAWMVAPPVKPKESEDALAGNPNMWFDIVAKEPYVVVVPLTECDDAGFTLRVPIRKSKYQFVYC